MASTVCNVQLLGNIGKDPEVRSSQSGNQVASFSLATQRKLKDEVTTQWHNCVCFGKLADIVQKYVVKGSKIYAQGTIDYSKYEKDGEVKYMTKIIVNEITLLSSDKKESDSPASSHSTSEYAAAKSAFNPELDDEIPF